VGVSEEPTIVDRPTAPYASIKVVVTMDQLGTVVPPLNGEVFSAAQGRGLMSVGPPFWNYNLIDMQRNP